MPVSIGNVSRVRGPGESKKGGGAWRNVGIFAKNIVETL